MNVVILGGIGFIGQHLIGSLQTNANVNITVFDRADPKSVHFGQDITYVQGNFTSGYDFRSLLHGADTIVHLISTSVPGTEKRVQDEITSNVIPSSELFESAVAEHVKNILFLSSGGTVYGDNGAVNSSERDIPAPINTYGLQKIMIEQALHMITHGTETNYQIVRMSNPYGPGQNPFGPLGLITKLVYQALSGNEIHVFGDGSVVRDFIFIDDAVHAVLDILDHGNKNDIYNVGTGKGVSVAQVIEAIDAAIPETLHLVRERSRAVDVPYSVLNIEKLNAISTLDSYISLHEGIDRTYHYFKDGQQ